MSRIYFDKSAQNLVTRKFDLRLRQQKRSG